MSKKIANKQWHNYFANALKIILGADYKIETEIEVGRMPLKIDVVVIKKLESANKSVKKLPASFKSLNKYNIIEYKSPDDILDIDSFDKLFAYALLYKIKYKIPSRELINTFAFTSGSITIIKNYIKRNRHKLSRIDDGIYYSNLGFNFYLIKIDELEQNGRNALLKLFGKLKPSDSEYIIGTAFYSGVADSDEIINISSELYPESLKEVLNQMRMTNQKKIFKFLKKELTKKCGEREVLKMLGEDEIIKSLGEEQVIKALGEEQVIKALGEEQVIKALGEEQIIKKIGEEKLLARLVKKFGIEKAKKLAMAQ